MRKARPPIIPIRVRLVIDHHEDDNNRDCSNNTANKKQKIDRSLDTYFPPLLHTTTTNNGGSNAPSTVESPVSDSSSMTVSEFTRYIVKEIYINNGEGHFIESNRRCDDQELEFVKILLQRLKSNGTNNTLLPDVTTTTFRYGGGDTRNIISKKNSNGNNHNGTSRFLTEENEEVDTTTCLIDFSLIDEQTEGYAITLAPTVNADKIFRTLLCCSSHQSNENVKRLELTLNAKVMIYRSPQLLESSTMATTAATSSSEPQSLIERARKNKRLSSQGILPKSLFNSINDTVRTKSTSTNKQIGSSHVLPVLRTQLERQDSNLVDKNENVRNATSDNEQLVDQTMFGLRGSTTKTKTKKRKVANDDANEVTSKRTKQSHNDNDNNNNNNGALAIQSAVQLIDGVPPTLDQAWQNQFVSRKELFESGHEQLIDSRNDTQERSATSCIAKDNLEVSHSLDESMSSNHSSIILLSQETEKLDDKCSIDNDDNDSCSDSSSSSSSSDDSDEEVHHIVAPINNVDDGVINANVKGTNRASETSQLNPDVDEHCTKDTNTSETVDSSSSSSSRDTRSDSDEPSICDDDGHGDDDNRDDVADKNILSTENLDDSVSPFEAAHANNADSLVKTDELANQDGLKNRDTSSVLNKNLSSKSRSHDDSSDSDSSCCGSSDESEDEGSIVKGIQILAEEAAKSNIKTQQASQHNITHNAPTSLMIGRATPYHTSTDVSEHVFTQESEIVPTNLFGNRFGNNQQHKRGGEIESSTLPTGNVNIKGEDDKDESSSSTSDTSSSSDSSSDSDSESRSTSSSSTKGKGVAKEVIALASIAPVPSSILPVVRTSRGRRRTPLVSMSRKIIINTTIGIPKTESFAR